MARLGTGKPRQVSARIVLIAGIVLSMAMLTAWSLEGQGGPLHATRNAVQLVASPLQRVGSVVALPFQAIGNAFTNAGASQQDLLALQQQVQSLQAQVIQNEEYRRENERLSQLLDMSTSYALASTGAHVIAQGADSWNRTITLDKGASDGITPGMPVMSGEGLIGQVESVTPATAVVRLLADSASSVSVTLQNSRAEGLVRGSVDGLLYLDYIPTSTTVALGEAVITSGLGGVYPKGLIVGVVSRIEGSVTDAYRTIVVQPMASSTTNEEVLVLIGHEATAASGATVVDGSAVGADGQANADAGDGDGAAPDEAAGTGEE